VKHLKIRAISFDAGGTLIAPRPSVGHVYAQVAEEQGLGAIQPELLNRQFAAAWKTRGPFDYSRKAWARVVRESFRGFCTKEESEALFPAIYDRFAQPRSWAVHEDVLPALEALVRRGLPMAVTSNWDERLAPLLTALRLAPHFQVLAISHDVGCCKPDAGIFEHACSRLGMPPANVLHIGDSQAEDVEGAEAAGLAALRIDRSLTRRSAVAIPSLSMLPDML
jgi:putative hydrolase of the HAD superfamily